MKTSLTAAQIERAGDFWNKIWDEDDWHPSTRKAASSIKCIGKIRTCARYLFEEQGCAEMGEQAIRGFDELIYLDTLKAIYELGISCGMEAVE